MGGGREERVGREGWEGTFAHAQICPNYQHKLALLLVVREAAQLALHFLIGVGVLLFLGGRLCLAAQALHELLIRGVWVHGHVVAVGPAALRAAAPPAGLAAAAEEPQRGALPEEVPAGDAEEAGREDEGRGGGGNGLGGETHCRRARGGGYSMRI